MYICTAITLCFMCLYYFIWHVYKDESTPPYSISIYVTSTVVRLSWGSWSKLIDTSYSVYTLYTSPSANIASSC